MKLSVSSFIAGALFGAGLTVSQMINPYKVISFLDISGQFTGQWDPSLAFVMLGALIITFIGYRFVLKKGSPLFGEKFHLPTKFSIDKPLIIGAVLFGVGWGIAGLCPGPALAGIGLNGVNGIIFLTSMLVTIGLYRKFLTS